METPWEAVLLTDHIDKENNILFAMADDR